MGLALRVIVAAIVALVVYAVLTTLVAFPNSGLIFGLLGVVIFLGLAFGPWQPTLGRWR